MKSELRVICETCGAARGKRCRSVEKPPGYGTLPMWQDRREVPFHRARIERSRVFARRRWDRSTQ